jgi:hypothetical protein
MGAIGQEDTPWLGAIMGWVLKRKRNMVKFACEASWLVATTGDENGLEREYSAD